MPFEECVMLLVIVESHLPGGYGQRGTVLECACVLCVGGRATCESAPWHTHHHQTFCQVRVISGDNTQMRLVAAAIEVGQFEKR